MTSEEWEDGIWAAFLLHAAAADDKYLDVWIYEKDGVQVTGADLRAAMAAAPPGARMWPDVADLAVERKRL